MLEMESGEIVTRRLEHENGEAKAFYAGLPKPSLIEATSYTWWFERMVADLKHELWVGDAAEIRARGGPAVEDGHAGRGAPAGFAAEPEIPEGVGAHAGGARSAATAEARNKLVPIQTSLRNQRHFLAMSQGLCRKQKLWSRQGRATLEGLSLGPWASQRRKELLELRDGLEPRLEELNQAVKAEAARRPEAGELMKPKGIGAASP